MKQVYNAILTFLTIAMLALLTFSKLNETANWVDMSAYTEIISVISTYGPMVLLCLFAFGSLFGRVLSKILFVVILLLLIAFSVAMFAPDWIASIFNKGGVISLFINLF